MEYKITAKNSNNGREVTYTFKPETVSLIDWNTKMQDIEDTLQSDKQF